jgi:hypothetical protein
VPGHAEGSTDEIRIVHDNLTPNPAGEHLSQLPISDDQIEHVRASLRQGPQGAQTTGWWLQRDGGRVRVRSGQDDNPGSWQKKAEQFLRRAFPDAEPGLLALARHAEVQLAFRLRDRAISDDVHEVVVIDRTVCGRDARTRNYDYTCDRLLPFVLDAGATLTVVEHDGTRVTYRGREPRR